MKVLVTGATGQLGREVVARLVGRGHALVLLARDRAKAARMFPGCAVVRGDVVREGLGLSRRVRADAVYHLAADVYLGSAHDSRVWSVNLRGTLNVLDFCRRNAVRRLFYAGTAYTGEGRNAYERSKKAAEEAVDASGIARKAVFKLGILVPGEDGGGAPEGTFYRFVGGIRKALGRTRGRERALRILGRSQARLNLVQAGRAAEFMVRMDAPGKVWLTHPDPARLGELAAWVGSALKARISFEPDFEMSAAEARFHRWAKAFLPYLRGDEFPSHMDGIPVVGREAVERGVSLLGAHV